MLANLLNDNLRPCPMHLECLMAFDSRLRTCTSSKNQGVRRVKGAACKFSFICLIDVGCSTPSMFHGRLRHHLQQIPSVDAAGPP